MCLNLPQVQNLREVLRVDLIENGDNVRLPEGTYTRTSIGISRSPLHGSLEMTNGAELLNRMSFRTPGKGEKSLMRFDEGCRSLAKRFLLLRREGF